MGLNPRLAQLELCQIDICVIQVILLSLNPMPELPNKLYSQRFGLLAKLGASAGAPDAHILENLDGHEY